MADPRTCGVRFLPRCCGKGGWCMTPNLFLLDETRAWLLRAAEDLAAAAALTAPATLRSALFHCQQAAEKSLKAFLTWHQRPFPRTHNLTVLSGFCAEVDASLDAAIAPSLALTQIGRASCRARVGKEG